MTTEKSVELIHAEASEIDDTNQQTELTTVITENSSNSEWRSQLHKPLQLKKTDKYFISIAQQGLHSFMMLGVVNDQPILLARVGKTNDIDPDLQNPLRMLTKVLGSKALSRITDEGITRKLGHSANTNTNISYQAYDINFEQVKEFLGLIAAAEKRQKTNYTNANNGRGIVGYIPVNEEQNKNEVIFEYRVLDDFSFKLPNSKMESYHRIIIGAQELHINNTCRTTALNMVEVVLGVVPDVSKFFFMTLKYHTKLVEGQPDPKTFYILPPSPNSFKKNFKETKILDILYKRMENIPKLNPREPRTRHKFDKLKALYDQISGPNTLSANQMLLAVTAHDTDKELLARRTNQFFAPLFLSSTEKAFNTMKSDLNKWKNEEDTAVNATNKGGFSNK